MGEMLGSQRFDVPFQMELQAMQRPMADGNQAGGRISGEDRFDAFGQTG